MSNDVVITNHKLVGKVNWAKVLQPQDKYKPKGSTENPGQEYSLDLLLDNELERQLLAIFKERNVPLETQVRGKGMVSKIKTNDDGQKFITLKRDAINSKGQAVTMPVLVLNKDKELVDFPKNLLIGNGSTAAVHVFIYDNSFGEGSIRLKGLQVLDLVKYEQDNDIEATEGGMSLEDMQSSAGDAEIDKMTSSPF